MKWKTKSFRANSSGQLLIVAALAIGILIFSTITYVYELSGERQSAEDFSLNDSILAVKQGSRNTVISALANASNGGAYAFLAENLNTLSQAYRNQNQRGTWWLSYNVLNDSNYDGGIWLSWNTNGTGVSSAYANFTLTVYDLTSNITLGYAINITTTILAEGYYIDHGTEKTVNLSCKVFNEGKPALADNLNLFYESHGVWMPVNSTNNLSTIDYGNGTYAMSFTVAESINPVKVSLHAQDCRGIFVQTIVTCREG